MKNRALIIKIALTLIACLSAAFFIINYILWDDDYRGRVYPGVMIGDLSLAGKTSEEAKDALSGKIKKIEGDGLKFRYNGRTVSLETATASFDSDLSYPALTFSVEETIAGALDNGSWRGFLAYCWARVWPGRKDNIKMSYRLDEDRIKAFLTDNFPELNINPENAYFSFEEGKDGLSLKNNPEKIGKEINYERAIADARDNLDRLNSAIIDIKTKSKYPTVKTGDLSGLEDEARRMFSQTDLTIQMPSSGNQAGSDKDSEKKSWTIKASRLVTWASARKTENGLAISLDREKVKTYLQSTISPQVDQEPVRPRFEMKGGRVSSWQTGQKGLAVDIDKTADSLINGFLNKEKTITVITKETGTEDLTNDNSFSIKEIIGTGHSSFTGSSANRRHNIATGAAALHGLLIKPGEEFSLIKALGDISDQTGYLPELVIKGNKTVPEYGGGLCQVGTTVFRSALASGLPITMRQNHSYRVSYYEPAGTDATIYTPQPDLRFINDTGNYILIQARMVKNDLYFDFWGVDDGRIATSTYPVIYNIVKPEPTKIIESDELKPGEKKCTESSHNGADAYFDYKVTYPEGSKVEPLVQEKRFKSHYVPWQAVCLVGRSATSSPSTATSSPSTASSTPESSPAPSIPTNTKATGTPAASSSLIKP
jgi:vancomycin resistance protein YoaR